MSAITFKDVSKRFKRTDAVRNLNMEVPEGRITAFLGSNGAGKTTTIKLLLGLHTQDTGHIDVLGADSRKLGPDLFRQIAYVSENQKLPLWMTVQQLLDFCRPLYNTWDRDLEATLLDRFELDPQQKLKHLSRGQQMKASLLSNLAYRPKLVVLDEPFSGLDPLVREEFIKGLLEFTEQEGWTVFISSHDIDEVERLADRVAMIDSGQLKLNESTDALLNRFREVQVPLRSESQTPDSYPASWLNFEKAGRFLRFTDSAWHREAHMENYTSVVSGITPEDISIRSLTLREIFIQLAQHYKLGLAAQKL